MSKRGGVHEEYPPAKKMKTSQQKFTMKYIGNKNRKSQFFQDMNNRMELIEEAAQNAAEDGFTGEEDPLVFFIWNDAGLQSRLAHAQLPGPQQLRIAGAPVTNVAQMKAALAEIICSGPNAGADLGGHHDIFQFLPAYKRDRMLSFLVTHYGRSATRGNESVGSCGRWSRIRSGCTNIGRFGHVGRCCPLLTWDPHHGCECCRRTNRSGIHFQRLTLPVLRSQA
jgi:hypothetical protein